jgi:hypothetical protein
VGDRRQQEPADPALGDCSKVDGQRVAAGPTASARKPAFGLPALEVSSKARFGPGLWLGELVATLGIGADSLRRCSLWPILCGSFRGRCLHRRGLLVHLLDELCQPGGNDRAHAHQYLHRHRAVVRAPVHRGSAGSGSAGGAPSEPPIQRSAWRPVTCWYRIGTVLILPVLSNNQSQPRGWRCRNQRWATGEATGSARAQLILADSFPTTASVDCPFYVRRHLSGTTWRTAGRQG